MRLDKYIADQTPHSRQQVRALLRRGRVTVDGVVARDPAQHIQPAQVVKLAGEIIREIGLQYWMVHKPAGYVSATKDREHQVVSSLIPMQIPDLHVAGRLDRDVTGLVILTNDGAWSHRLTSPRHDCAKRYRVTTFEPIPQSAVQAFAEGILLHNENQTTKPAKLEIHSEHQATLWLTEGRFHQVKRMFISQGCKVVALHRDQIGEIELNIAVGEARALTAEEIGSVE